MEPIGFFYAAVGLFALVSAVTNWDWFMNNKKAKFVATFLTRDGARIFYGVLGIVLLVLGILVV